LFVIFQDQHLLDWSNFGLLNYPCKSQIWSSGFWGRFIQYVHLSILIVLHCIIWDLIITLSI